MPEAFNPIERPLIWELAAEFAVIIALFGTGIRIDNLAIFKIWRPTIGLLVVAMPLCIWFVAYLGLTAGLSLGAAIILAAILVPTDPVLAADVQVGPPLEGGEHPIRFALTTEAGLNDGLAFPFVYLGILIAAGSFELGEWLGFYVLYKIILGVIIGAGAGWLLGKLLFTIPRTNVLADSGSGVIAIAGVLITYGFCELLEGYGFIAVFCMGIVLRREESDHEYHRELHTFSESIEQTMTALLLVMLGGALPVLGENIDWRLIGVGFVLILLIRPVTGLMSLSGSALDLKQRAIVSFYGVRGIGSIYYLAYAAGHTYIDNIEVLWSTVAITILASAILHGFTAGTVVGTSTEGPSSRNDNTTHEA